MKKTTVGTGVSLESILARAISPNSVKGDGTLTRPRSFGVYELATPGTSARYRFGNHPVRQLELERDFGGCKLEHLFLRREDARDAARLLNEA